MRWFVSVAIATLFTISAIGDDTKPPIRFPTIKVKDENPPPKPPPADQAVTLESDSWYVVESDVECLIFLSPGGSVGFTKEAGPIKLKGKFAGGNGKVETRSYVSKYLYVFDPMKDGRDELLIMPVGIKKEADAFRQTFQVGQMPQPPPRPDPDPKPPKPDEPVVITSFKVIFVKDPNSNLSIDQHAVFYGKAITDYLDAKCTKQNGQPEWRRYQQNTNATNDLSGMAELWADVQAKITGVTCMVIAVNKKAEIVPLPANVADALALLKKYGGN